MARIQECIFAPGLLLADRKKAVLTPARNWSIYGQAYDLVGEINFLQAIHQP
jgi:hypothetical protein